MGQLMKRKKNQMCVYGMIGCVPKHKKDTLFKNLPGLDFIAGPSDVYDILKTIEKVKSQKSKVKKEDGDRRGEQISVLTKDTRPLEHVDPIHRASKDQAFVNIMYGCNNYCSYCIVPYVRGREVSRPVEDIVMEVEGLVGRGIKHIILLGQNVNSYKSDDIGFVGLLARINDIKGIKKIGFLTSHPKDASVELFKAMRDLEHVEKSLHLPIQSGSNRILKLMNRGYTVEKYKELVKQYRDIVGAFGKKPLLSTDIIVGYPTESEEEYECTVELVRDLTFDSAYVFKYSPRPPAKSSEMKDDVADTEKRRRNNKILEMLKPSAKNK
jgi:tRNA-2-methylthio-N6-dimethylallyladenosine synthase